MSTIGRRGGRVAAGCRQPPCRFAASLFAPNRWFVHLAGQHFGPLRTVEADRERERGEQGGPGGDAMMRSRHMLRPLGDSAYTRLLINSQAFVLANSTGEITPRNNLSFFFSFFFQTPVYGHRLLHTINRASVILATFSSVTFSFFFFLYDARGETSRKSSKLEEK